MSVPNAYPPSRSLPQGGRSAQNVAFNGTSVMRLLGEGTRFLGLLFGEPSRDLLARLRDLKTACPVELRTAAVEGPLAAHLVAYAGSFVLLRPDAYVAATLHDATEQDIRNLLEHLA